MGASVKSSGNVKSQKDEKAPDKEKQVKNYLQESLET